ncbi:hypothetical protein HHI36_009225, partial [Cryptolaemus montrouzieri]
ATQNTTQRYRLCLNKCEYPYSSIPSNLEEESLGLKYSSEEKAKRRRSENSLEEKPKKKKEDAKTPTKGENETGEIVDPDMREMMKRMLVEIKEIREENREYREEVILLRDENTAMKEEIVNLKKRLDQLEFVEQKMEKLSKEKRRIFCW